MEPVVNEIVQGTEFYPAEEYPTRRAGFVINTIVPAAVVTDDSRSCGAMMLAIDKLS